jgi:hypothetical protein
VAVDAKHKLIVEQQVTNQVADIGLLTQTAEPAKAALGVETIAVVADRGHFKIEDIEACEKAGDGALCAAPTARVSGQGRLLSQGRIQLRAQHRQLSVSGRPAAWRLFVISAAWAEEDQICQPHRLPGLSVAHEMHKELIPLGVSPGERSRAGPDGGANCQATRNLDRRRDTVEHPFGSIKQWMNQGAFLMRGMEEVRGEFSLTALAYNLRRVLNLVGFTTLMAAVQT